jgi:hypothetical protein
LARTTGIGGEAMSDEGMLWGERTMASDTRELDVQRLFDYVAQAVQAGLRDQIGKPVNPEAARIAVERFLRGLTDKGMLAARPPLGVGPVLMVARARACVDQVWGYRVMGVDLPDDRVRLVLLDELRVADAQPGAAEGRVAMEMACRVLAEFAVRWPEAGDPVALGVHAGEETP